MTSDTTKRAADVAARSLVAQFLERSAADARRPAVRWKSRGLWKEATWADYRRHVERTALGLLRLEVEPGAPVVFLGRPAPGWLYADLAAQSIGALPVLTHATMPPDALAHVLESVKPSVVVLTQADQLERFLAVESPGMAVKHLIAVGVQASAARDPRVMSLAELEALGADDAEAAPERWEALASSRSLEEPAVVAVSAGTTGDPRLAVLTGANLLGAWSWLGALPRPLGRGDRVMTSMALGQLAERGLSQIAPIVFGSVVHFPEDEVSLGEARREIRPTAYFAPPHVWEAEAAAGAEALDAAPLVRRSAYRAAVRLKRGRLGGALAQRLALGPLLDRFGYRRLRLPLTGGERLAPRAAEQWRRWGLQLHDVYGTVECSGAAAVSDGTQVLRGHGVQLSVAGDGELLVAGPGVAAAYWDETPVPTDDEGLARTCDFGEPGDGVGVLGSTARRLRLADGTEVDPAVVEATLRGSRYIARAVVFGEGLRALGALIEPDVSTLSSWARRHGMSHVSHAALLADPAVLEHVAKEVAAANESLAQRGCPPVAEHRVLGDLLLTGEALSPSGTVRAASPAGAHALLIDLVRSELSGGTSAAADQDAAYMQTGDLGVTKS